MFSAYYVGLAVALLLDPSPLMNRATREIERQSRIPPDGVLPEEWEAATAMPDETPGVWLGYLERALTFMALSLDVVLIIIGWLGFKVASKWQVWQSVIRVPHRLSETRPLDYFRATRTVGDLMAMRFLIGTISNVLAGGVGFLVAKGLELVFACAPTC